MIKAVEIEIVGRHPLTVSIGAVLRAITDCEDNNELTRDLSHAERSRAMFLLRVCSLRLIARVNELQLPARLVTLQHGPGFVKLIGDVHVIRSAPSPLKLLGLKGEMVTVVIVFARNPESREPTETAHLFRKSDLRLESALRCYEAERLMPVCSVIQMLVEDFATCRSLNVVPPAPAAAEPVAGEARSS